jgi:hypothetical protein
MPGAGLMILQQETLNAIDLISRGEKYNGKKIE